MGNVTAWLFTLTAFALGAAPEPATRAPAPLPEPLQAQTQPPTAAKELPAARTEAQLTAAVTALQKTYEGTGDFEARFTQRYTYTLLRRTQESQGTVRFQKPGHMRWDYSQPSKKSFIVDQGKLWVHQPEDGTAMVDHCFKQDGLTASVAFLWGSGDIQEQFNVSWFDGVFGKETDQHLLLEPKQPNSIFARLILVVDPKTHRVQQSVVVDVQGNVNQFLYQDLKFNKGLKAGAFAFKPAEGTHISRMPGSCDPDAKAAGG
jgi:outer membrane lipoprotein carrier protein